MTKQCPNCGTEIDNEEVVCSNCGYSFKEEAKIDETSEKRVETEDEESTSNFINKEQNENIEWSELKDMSIGHVMTMFNEQQEESTVSEEDQQAPETTTDSKETGIEETGALSQYINEHKNEQNSVDEESTESKESSEQQSEQALSSTAADSLEKTSEPSVELNSKGQDEVKSNDIDNNKAEQAKQNMPKEEITKFTKPEEQPKEEKTIGPKPLPTDTTKIPSKSKKPEEIEMDAAPIFFKEGGDEAPAKNQFEKPAASPSTNESISEPTNNQKNKNYKKMSIILAAVVVLAGGSWFAYNQTQKKTSGTTQVSGQQEKLAAQTEKELNSYFTDDKQVFIKPEMVNVSLKTIKENLDTLKEDSDYKKLDTLYEKVATKQTAITQVNELFSEPIISGNKLNDAAIKADKKVEVTKRAEKDDFDKLINQGIDQAMTQYDQLQKAKVAVEVIYKDNQLTEALSRETYNAAKTEVDKVKSESLRKPLTESLTKADQALTDAEAANAAQQQAINDQQANQTAASGTTGYDNQGNVGQTTTGVQPDASTFSPANADGVYTDPVYSANPSDLSDMSNPAWSWAPGVQDKVIATCIERGYITAGNYSLQPARIINGEGYYNLYGGDGQYLVTINAKTGWFKGNASRNAGR
jgi:hypothetical protein